MTSTKSLLKSGLSLAIVCSVIYFFCKAFQANWTNIQAQISHLSYLFIVLSFLFTLISCLLSTYSWHLALNALSGGKHISFAQSVATVNVSGLTKYIPGKVWSYALQMYWLVNAGFSKSVIVYVNLVNLLISIISSLIVGIGYLLFSPGEGSVTTTVNLTILLALVLFDILFIRLNVSVTNGLISFFNRVFKQDLKCFSISHKLLFRLHMIHFIAAFCFGMSAYLLCYGIGIEIVHGKALLVMSSLLISDVIGFLAIIVPGGLGVREGVMYFLLNNVSTAALSLLLPVAIRIISMIVDIFLGAIAFILLRKYQRAVHTRKHLLTEQ